MTILFDSTVPVETPAFFGDGLHDIPATPKGTLAVLGKGRRQKQTMTLPEPTKAVLTTWVALRGTEAGPLLQSLDRARKGSGRLTGSAVHYVVTKLAKAAGCRCSPHALRHTSVTAGLDLTKGDVRAVRQHSRHVDVQTVLIYDDRRADLGGSVARMVATALRHELGHGALAV
jgi:integrase/recombinase XerC